MLRILLAVVVAAFAALTAYAIADTSFWGIFEYQFATSAGWQVLADLVIVSALAMLWMIVDARKTGRNPWPFVLLTIPLGSFGILLYLLVGQKSAVMANPGIAVKA